MRLLMIIEGLGLLYCLYSWIRDHPKSRIEWIVSVGKRLSHCLFRKRYRKVHSECCEMMFPDCSVEERKRQYMAYRVGGLVLGMLLGNAVFLTAMYLETPEIFPGVELERPSYGEDEVVLQYQLEVEGNGERVTENMKIEVPQQKPSVEEIDQQFIEAEKNLKNLFDTCTAEQRDIELPESYKEIVYQYKSQNPEILKDDGEILWKNLENEQTVHMDVTLVYGDRSKEVEYELFLKPKESSLRDDIADVQRSLDNGDYLSDEKLELPSEGRDGIQYHWSLRKDYSYVWMGVLWIVVLPVMVAVLREQERKRKVRLRKVRIQQRYPDMLNKLMILMGAGMSITKAWLKITEDYMTQKTKYNQEEPLYEEMLQAGLRLNNGYSMSEVIRVFAQRNSIREIQQFCGILQTGWKRGDAHVLLHLKELHDRSWEVRKRTARKLSEEADTKLLLPLMLMLMVVLIIVLAPAMMTMKI